MIRSLVLPVVIVLLSAVCGVAQPLGTDAVESFGQGSINWTSGEVSATGIGAPPANAVNAAQSRAMAERAAMVVAYRNLLEIVKGVRVDSESVVENFMTKSDVIRTRVDGVVRGAMPVKKQYLSDGSVEITISMKMRGAFMDAIVPDAFGNRGAVMPAPTRPVPVPSMPQPTRQAPSVPPPSSSQDKRVEPVRPAPQQVPPAKQEPPHPPEPHKPAPLTTPSVPPVAPPSQPAAPVQSSDQSTAQFKGGKATGVVIDGRGLGLKPALLPKIVDPQGQEIYVGQVVTRTNAVEQGVAGYAKDVNAAANNFRVTDNPAVIRGLRASGAARTDIILSSADAQALRDISQKGDFLQYCRVIIVY